MLTIEQIESNWKRLIGFIEEAFDGERQENLLKLYNEHENRIAAAPASSKTHFHSAFIGGYVHHVLNVMKIAPKISALWESIDGEKVWTDEELFFVALNHDLGKIGDLKHPNYVETMDDWKKKRGMEFETNPDIIYMPVEDRSLYLLQHYGVKMTQREWVGIKTHDGLYSDGNKSYYNQWVKELDRFVYIIHFADMMATKQEYEEWEKTPEARQFLKGESKLLPKTYKGKKAVIKTLNSEPLKNADIKIEKFEDLFGNTFGDNK